MSSVKQAITVYGGEATRKDTGSKAGYFISMGEDFQRWGFKLTPKHILAIGFVN